MFFETSFNHQPFERFLCLMEKFLIFQQKSIHIIGTSVVPYSIWKRVRNETVKVIKSLSHVCKYIFIYISREARKAMVMNSLLGGVWREGKGRFGAREARKAMVMDSVRGRFEGKGNKIPTREKCARSAKGAQIPSPFPFQRLPRRLVMNVGQISKKTYMRLEGCVTSTNVI